MQLINAPSKIPLPFASSGAKNTIPEASQIGITAGAASLTDGFPPLTYTPLAAGGVPVSPFDVNGILFELSAIIRWANAGGGYPFDNTFATDTNVTGYPKGARVLRSDGLGYWFNTTDNNVTDPESGGAIAAGWLPDYTTGATAITMTSANVTLTALQYGNPIILITGILTANLNLIFPAIVGQWTIINGTTGAFGIICKTASGTGVITNSNSPIRKLIGDGTNIYASAAAAGVNGDISALTALASINGGQLAGNRRKGINGDFSVNQLSLSGAVTLSAGAYGHDGWKAGAGGCTYTFATVNNLTTVTITAGTLLQVLEGIKLQSGTYTLSWGGTCQGRWGSGSYAASGVYGTIVGGTDINIEFGTGTLLLVQPEPGTTPTAFEFKDNELSLCQRYYETGDLPSFVVVQTVLGVFPGRNFATPKRVVPAMTLTPASGGGATVTPGIAGFYQSTDHSGNAQCAWAASARM